MSLFPTMNLPNLPEDQMDLVSWLIDQEDYNNNKQDFYLGAKDLCLLPSGNTSEWLPSEDLCRDVPDDDLLYQGDVDMKLEDCIAVDTNASNWQDMLIGSDAEFVRQVDQQHQLLQLNANKQEQLCHEKISINNSIPQFSTVKYDNSRYEPSKSFNYQTYSSPHYGYSDSANSPLSSYSLASPPSVLSEPSVSSDFGSPLSGYDESTVDFSDINFESSKKEQPYHVHESLDQYSDVKYEQIYNKPETPFVEQIGITCNPISTETDEEIFELSDDEGGYQSPSLCVIDGFGDYSAASDSKNVIYCKRFSSPRTSVDSITGSLQGVSMHGVNSDSNHFENNVACSQKRKAPYTQVERKLRKKEQNKRAAIRYREKKKLESDEIEGEYTVEVNKYEEVQSKLKAKISELLVYHQLALEKIPDLYEQ